VNNGPALLIYWPTEKKRSDFAVTLQKKIMKRTHLIILMVFAVAVVALIIIGFSSSDFSTYDTIASARNKPGKFVHLIANLDKGSVEYNAAKDPNYLSFTITDTVGGGTAKVVYHNSKPTELEQSERVVLKGKMTGDVFECSSITLKCPSKYKDDNKQLQKTVGN
jgi:cytochrome c-type biogenesis protein CcmE